VSNAAASARRPGRRAAYFALAGLTLYLGVLGLLLRPTGGLLGRYTIVGPSGQEITVHQRVDPRIDFPIPHRLDAAYIFNWDLGRDGFPAAMPPYVVHWSGLLRVPEAGSYGFSVDAQGEAGLSIDSLPLEIRPDALTERRLEAGWHPIALDYRLAEGEARLVLSWRPPGRPQAPVPTAFLTPDRDAIARGGARRGGAWIVLAGGGAAVLLAALLARRPGSRAADWIAGLRAERTRIALGAILILAAVLRFHDYALVPFHHETADEYQHAWEGWHLLHERVPAAWSAFPDRYPISQVADFRWFGDRYVLVRPYFDHPPLFSILVGLVTSLGGAKGFLSCTLPVMRLVPIVLSLAGVLLLYPLARGYGASERAALLAALVYAVLPVIVLADRLVKGESLLALLFMGAILLVQRHERFGRTRDAAFAGVLCGLSIWTKATGVAVLATVLILLLARRRHRAALLAAGITAGFVGLYLLYAWAYDFGIFLKIMQAQSTSKWVALDSFLDLLSGKVVTKFFGRGWYLWLMLAAAVAAFRKEKGLLVPIVIYGAMIALTADHRVIYGWYRIPIYAFLCVAAGIYLDEMIRESDLFHAAPFAATAVVTGLVYALPAGLGAGPGRWTVALFATLAFGPYLARLARDTPLTGTLARAASFLLVLTFLATSIVTVNGLLEIYAATRGVQ
jgi:hypothetical protein